eukprot:scaffold3137_cov227-Ochromonas_danica.AAC.2
MEYICTGLESVVMAVKHHLRLKRVFLMNFVGRSRCSSSEYYGGRAAAIKTSDKNDKEIIAGMVVALHGFDKKLVGIGD